MYYNFRLTLLITGRRNCQTRLVQPIAHSINSGDAFILVVPDRVYVFLGQFCNVIEKAKAMDVSGSQAGPKFFP